MVNVSGDELVFVECRQAIETSSLVMKGLKGYLDSSPDL